MTRPSPWRTTAILLVLSGAAVTLGPPPRPRLPVGAITASVMTRFVTDGLRLLVTVSLWYLLLAAVLALTAHLPGVRTVTRPIADRVVAVGVASVLRRVMATSAVVGAVLPAGAAAQSADPADEVPTMVPVPTEGRESSTGRASSSPQVVEPDPGDPPVMTRDTGERPPAMVRPDRVRELVDTGPSIDRPTSEPTHSPPRPATVAEGDMNAEPDVDITAPTHTVKPGESFWTIAEGLAGRGAGAEADIDAVARTWQRLIDRNADILVDTGNPDLLHVGQVIDVS